MRLLIESEANRVSDRPACIILEIRVLNFQIAFGMRLQRNEHCGRTSQSAPEKSP
jgi:hypothetical protein